MCKQMLTASVRQFCADDSTVSLCISCKVCIGALVFPSLQQGNIHSTVNSLMIDEGSSKEVVWSVQNLVELRRHSWVARKQDSHSLEPQEG